MIKIGIIGCGMAGLTHIRCLNMIKGVFISHVYDTSFESAKRAAEISKSKIASSIDEILTDINVNAVVIASPPDSHAKLAIRAIESKKNVLIEKPIAINTESLKSLKRSCDNHPDLIIIDGAIRHSRLNEKFDYIKSMLNSNKIGDVYAISHLSLCKNSRPGIEFNSDAKWFLDKKVSGGGPIVDWGCYDLSFYSGLLNDDYIFSPANSYCANGLDDISFPNIEEHFFVNLLAKSKRVSNTNKAIYLSLERSSYSYIAEPINLIRIHGKKGSIIINGYPHWESSSVDIYDTNNNSRSKKFYVTGGHDYDFSLLAKHFIDCIYGYDAPKLSITRGIYHMETILSCIQMAVWNKNQDVENSV
jgi:predicted dehydrogenase